MANDTLPLVFHTERYGRLVCTREETDAVRVRVLRVVTPKTSLQRRILSKTRGRQRVVSWSQGMGKNLNRFLLPATTPRCDKMHTKIIPATTPPYAKPAYTKHAYESDIPRLYIYSFLKPLKDLTQIRERERRSHTSIRYLDRSGQIRPVAMKL